MKQMVRIASLFVLAAVSTPVSASQEDQIVFGEYLSSQCVTCHQASGADKGIPSIVGWEPIQFVAVMTAYKERELQNPVMQNIAGQLSREEIEALALYFGRRQPEN